MRPKNIDLLGLEHISSKDFCDRMDEILDQISKEDIAMIIDHGEKSYLIMPFEWSGYPSKAELNRLAIWALRYALASGDQETELLPEILENAERLLTTETLNLLLKEIDKHRVNNPPSKPMAAFRDIILCIIKERGDAQ